MTAHRFTLPALLSLALLAAGCGGDAKTAAPSATAAAAATTTAVTPGRPILTAKAKPTSFADVQRRVASLYKAHGSDLKTYSYQDVRYTAATRDKVLRTCRSAGPNDGVPGIASTKAVGCAPLIFYYYNYGARSGVPASVDLAQRLYWYALTNEHGPKGATASLTTLLRSWGIH
jgi:hypothetical protein